MDAERWKHVKEIFNAALEKQPVERPRFIEESCGDDDDLRKEVDSLLSAFDEPDKFVDQSIHRVAGDLFSDDEAESLEGAFIAHYKIERKIGRGGMGEVFLAKDPRLGRRAAIKVLPSDYSKDQDRIQRFKREARAASTLNHPNILTIYEIGETEGRHFIAAEFIEGKTLRELLSSGEMTLSEKLDAVIQTANALAAAHSAGIVHRDIKPENIMIREDGYVKVLDFGLAKSVEDPTETETDSRLSTIEKMSTSPGMIMGTTRYMSPEQARGQKVDAGTDIFSLGVMLYEMVAGVLPFDGKTNSDVIAAILAKDPPPLERYAPDVPPQIGWIIEKALRKERDERYQNVKDMLGELQSVKDDLQFRPRASQAAPSRRQAAGMQTAGERSSQDRTEINRAPAHTTQVMAQKTASKEKAAAMIGIRRAALIAFPTILLLLGAWFGFEKYSGRFAGSGWFARSAAASLFQPDKIKIRKLPANGSEIFKAISPDGRYMVYSKMSVDGISLYVRQMASDSSLKLFPVGNSEIWKVHFSKDSNFIYYVREDNDKPIGGALYRIPTLGGEPQKLLERLGPFYLSPDGSQAVCLRLELGEAVLFVTDLKGSEKRIAARKLPNSYRELSWSPDGKVIIAAAQNFDPNGSYGTLVAVPAEGGPEKLLTSERWPATGASVWLPDGSGFILHAKDATSFLDQLWLISYPSGEVRRITNDYNSYGQFGLTADGSLLAAGMGDTPGSLLELSSDDLSRPRKITLGLGNYVFVCYAKDGRILYTSRTVEGEHVWIMEADGRRQKQLTSGHSRNFSQTVSPDGRRIAFISNRNGNFNVWRMDLEGGDLKQLTNGVRDYCPTYSPDGRWIVYMSYISGFWKLCKIPAEGGEPTQLYETIGESFPAVSPDGKLIACEYQDRATKQGGILVIPIDGGAAKKLPYAPSSYALRWSPDGKGLTFVLSKDGIKDFWQLPIDGGLIKRLTDLKMQDRINYFDWSPDGKRLIFDQTIVLSEILLITNSNSQ